MQRTRLTTNTYPPPPRNARLRSRQLIYRYSSCLRQGVCVQCRETGAGCHSCQACGFHVHGEVLGCSVQDVGCADEMNSFTCANPLLCGAAPRKKLSPEEFSKSPAQTTKTQAGKKKAAGIKKAATRRKPNKPAKPSSPHKIASTGDLSKKRVQYKAQASRSPSQVDEDRLTKRRRQHVGGPDANFQCAACEKLIAVGGAHACDRCGVPMHGFCGLGIGLDSLWQPRRCESCL